MIPQFITLDHLYIYGEGDTIFGTLNVYEPTIPELSVSSLCVPSDVRCDLMITTVDTITIGPARDKRERIIDRTVVGGLQPDMVDISFQSSWEDSES